MKKLHKILKRLLVLLMDNKLKISIVFILLTLSCLFYIFSVYEQFLCIKSDFWTNLSAGAVWSMVTILLIDSLVYKNKFNKLKSINNIPHNNILLMTRHIMAKYMLIFEYIKKDDFFDLLDNGEEKFTVFISSTFYKEKWKQLDKFESNTGDFLRMVQKETEAASKLLVESLEKVEPYPDPSIMEYVKNRMPYLQGRIQAGLEIIDIFFNKIPKEISVKGMNEMKPGMDVLWKIQTGNFPNKGENFRNDLLELFNFLLDVNARAKKGELFYSVD